MKKIMFISNQLGGGGAERVLTILANLMEIKDNNIILCSLYKTSKKYVISNKIKVKELNCRNLSIIKQLGLLRQQIKEERPDIIISFEYHVNMKVLLAIRHLKRIKAIISERNDPAQQKNRKFVNFLRDYLYRKADVLVCQTPDAKAYFSPKVQNHTVVIPNPVKSDLPKYCGQDSKTIINFCRLENQKNLPLLIDAFELLHNKHNDAKLVIYGDGKEKDYLQEIIDNKHLEKLVNIFPATNEIHQIASKCKMFVSSSDYEGLSNSMLEAMAMGMPVICTDCPCGGARMVIENNVNGLLVPVGSVQDLYVAMERILTDYEFAITIGQNASKIAIDLAQDKIAEKWYELL